MSDEDDIADFSGKIIHQRFHVGEFLGSGKLMIN